MLVIDSNEKPYKTCPCVVYNVSVWDVKNVLSSLPATFAGQDLIPNKFWKEFGKAYSESLTKFLNNCKNFGCILDTWKLLLVIPLYKSKGEPSECENYRPISLTSTLCKICERLVNKILLSEISKSMSPYQHGFTSKKNNILNLLVCYNLVISELDLNKCIDVWLLKGVW